MYSFDYSALVIFDCTLRIRMSRALINVVIWRLSERTSNFCRGSIELENVKRGSLLFCVSKLRAPKRDVLVRHGRELMHNSCPKVRESVRKDCNRVIKTMPLSLSCLPQPSKPNC